MFYKELYTIEYFPVNWDEIIENFASEWKNKIEADSWYYLDENKREYDSLKQRYVNITRKLSYKHEKFNFLVNWESKHKQDKGDVSPLYNLRLQEYSHDDDSFADYMFRNFREMCKESFVDLNMPIASDSINENYHREKLYDVFRSSEALEIECKDRFEEIIENHFLFKHLLLMVKYRLPNKGDLTHSLIQKYNKLILAKDWKVMDEINKLHKPKSKLDFIKQSRDCDDGDYILNHMYINAKRTLCEEIQDDAKKNYQSGFIYLNMSPEIKGTLFEDESIVKLGKLFNENYEDLAEQFVDSILDMYSCTYVLSLFNEA